MQEGQQDSAEGSDTGCPGGFSLQKRDLRAFFHRIKSRRGWAKAIVATGHKILTIAFQMLCSNTPYKNSATITSGNSIRLAPQDDWCSNSKPLVM